jgi:hypothetical protein
MATSEEAPKVVPQEDSTATVTIATETEKPGKLDLTNSGQITNNTVAPGDDLVMNGSVTGENESTVSPGNDPATTPENGVGLVVTVCGTTEAGEEVCVTVGRERGEGRERSGSLPNGKLSSTAFPRQHRHNRSFSSTRSGRLSPYGSEGHSSPSDVGSLYQDSSFSADLHLVAEQLKQDLLSQLGTAEKTGERREGEDLTKTLLEHVVKLKMELASVKEENERLQNVRSNMDNEIHELTENLFEEAYKMVDKAKGGKVSAEKRLADAAGKIDAMETEMSTLKRIIQNPPPAHSVSKTTGASPNTLHLPQLHSPSQKHIKRSSIKRAVHKIQKRTGLAAPKSPSTSTSRVSPIQPLVLEHKGGMRGDCLVTGEIDQEEYAQFHHWIKSISVSSPPSPPSLSSPSSAPPSPSPPSLSLPSFWARVEKEKERHLARTLCTACRDKSSFKFSIQDSHRHVLLCVSSC